METKDLKFWQIWNMSFGFLGIQFGWALQMANMSPIYEYLKAEPDELPILWLAAPLTGLIVQPIIGNMSDKTWGPLGRRRPYFLVGAILSSIALVLMPNCSALWMAAGLLWILDASINISMEPFRAFVADLLPERQRTKGFAMQSFFIGLGAVVASALPWLLTNVFHMSDHASHTGIPTTIKVSFYIGACAFFGAVLWTILTTKEHPPADMENFKKMKEESRGIKNAARDIFSAMKEMPKTMKQLAIVQTFTWLGLFCMFLYFSVAVANNIFHAPDQSSPLYKAGVEWAGLCSAVYALVCFLVSFLLPPLAGKLGRKNTHTLCLILGGLGLMSVAVIQNKYLLFLSMAGVGIAWASILSMPYAILAGCLPEKRIGVYMGIFNFSIVLPEIVAALGFGWVMSHILNNNRVSAVILGGFFLIVAAFFMQRVHDVTAAKKENAR